ncbi:MAG TPA: hypothetical protein VLD59_15390 [Steroidobacteraceae bacterium]|nr:hypothetical protein [Steroidobacteraceae bacterium]
MEAINLSPRARAATLCETLKTHNARHQHGQDSQCFFASVPRGRGSVIAKSSDFPFEFDEGGGLKIRCRERKKNAVD